MSRRIFSLFFVCAAHAESEGELSTFKCIGGHCVNAGPGGITQESCENACQEITPQFLSINAITLATADMLAAFTFYTDLGLNCTFGCERGANWSTFGGPDQELHSFHINLYPAPSTRLVPRQGWGRCVFYVNDVDAVYSLALRHGLQPEFAPRDADWGERYFHILDPSGHELAIAAPLPPRSPPAVGAL